MIALRNVFDTPEIAGRKKFVALGVTLDIPPGRYAVLSKDSELLRPAIDLLAGLRPPRRGSVFQERICSWPIGRPGIIRGRLTGVQIISFLSRIYGFDQDLSLFLIKEMMTNKSVINKKIDHWVSKDRIEFSLILSILPNFGIYIIDGNLPNHKDKFSSIWYEIFEEKSAKATIIASMNRTSDLKELCDKALIFENGSIIIEEDLTYALSRHSSSGHPAFDAAGSDQGDISVLGADVL